VLLLPAAVHRPGRGGGHGGEDHEEQDRHRQRQQPVADQVAGRARLAQDGDHRLAVDLDVAQGEDPGREPRDAQERARDEIQPGAGLQVVPHDREHLVVAERRRRLGRRRPPFGAAPVLAGGGAHCSERGAGTPR